MGDRAAKDALLEQFAAVGKALGSPKRLELLDLLAQSPRSVEDRAGAAGLGLSTCSANLQTLRSAGLVETRRAGKKVYYSLAGQDVAALWDALRSVAQRHRPHTELARLSYLGPDDTQEVDTKELMRRLADGGVLVLDVRPRHGTTPGTSRARFRFRSRSSSSASPSFPLTSRWSRTAAARTACSRTTRSGC